MRVYRRFTVVGVVLTLVAGLVAGLPPAAVAAAAAGLQEPSTPVKPVNGKAPAVAQPPLAQAVRPVWPTAGSAEVPLDGPPSASIADGATVSGSASPGGLPVSVRAAAASSSLSADEIEGRMVRGRPVARSTAAGVSSVDVTVLDQTATARLGVRGVVFTAAPSDSSASARSSTVEISVSYQAFATAYGGGFSDRLRLVSLPACALTMPEAPACQTQTPVPAGFNDKLTATVSAPVDLGSASAASAAKSASALDGGGGQVLAVTAGSSSEQGDWSATSLSQAGTWQAGASAGGFSYSLPMSVPPAPGGLTPKISLDYSSASVDGLTKSTTSQASWIGEGWNYEPGYVERSYRPCRDDGQPSNEGDLCWVSQSPVTVMLNGVSSRLLRDDATGVWKAEDDSAGWKVERLTGLNNSARDGESFKITTRDGTRYLFGSKHHDSYGGVLNVEVFGNNSGEPCYNASGFRYSHCPMPYRWNLDQVVDIHGNVIDYQWWRFQGSFGGNNGDDIWVYDIHGRLGSIEYGKNVNAGTAGAHHTGKVTFGVTWRCFVTEAECDDPANRHLWMDVPWDQHCETWAPSCATHTPTFWNIYRLINIRSFVWDAALNGGAGGWPAETAFVDQWETTQGFATTGDYIPPAGDDSSPSLWLMRLWRSGYGHPIEMGGTQLDNRVDYGTGKPPMMRWRVNQIASGTGDAVNVIYSPRDCYPGDLASIVHDNNTRRCYPQNDSGTLSWWHKYVVTDVWVRDYLGGAPDERWHYDYSTANSSSAVMWKHDQSWHTVPAQRTWSRWAGYPTVTTTHGAFDGSGPQQVTENLYFRGMHGDKTTAGWGTRVVSINDGWDPNIADADPLAGTLRRSFTLNGPGGSWTAAVRRHHSITQTGSFYMTANPTITANRVRETETLSGTVLAGPNYRWTQTLTDYEPGYGLPIKVQDLGEIIPANPNDDRCALTSYATPDTGKWLIGLQSQTLTTNCAASPAGGDYLAGNQYFYDGTTMLGAMPINGLVTKTTSLATVPAAQPTSANWKQSSRSAGHDVYGRAADSFDALDRKTSTVYVPAAGGPVTETRTTGPMGAGWTVTTTLDPKRGQPTKVVDVNGKTTQAEYDSSDGRLLKVWKNNRAKTLTPDLEFGYSLDPSWVSTKALGPDGQQILSYQIFDGRLRPRQTQTLAATGTGRTITDTTYNGLGLADKTSTFYNSTAPESVRAGFDDKDIKVQQRFVHDNLGRTTAEQQWTGNGTTSNPLFETLYTFDGDKTFTMKPPAGGTAMTTINDVRGQTVELRQHLGGVPTGAVDVTTKYTYDRLGQLTKVTDNANKQWTYIYDLRGRKTQTVDPDAGTSSTTFDDAGQAAESVNGNNKKLAYKYDLLGRKTEVRDNSLTGYLRASWTYDPAGAKGQLASTSRYDATGTYTTIIGEYDDAYRVKKTTYSIPGFASGGSGTLSYEVKNTYKADGLLATQILPSISGLNSETLTYTYNAAAKPLAVSNSAGQTYVAASEYSYDGLLTRQTLGNTNTRVRLNTGFDDATRRLTTSAVELETATPNTYRTQYANTFSYDHAGNVTAIAGQTHNGTTLAADQQECFTYDHLRRMTEAWTQTNGTCTTPQRTGADPYRRQWPASGGYDKLGSRLKQIDKDTSDTTWNYTIGGVDSCGGSSKPHAVTSIAATGPKAGTPTRTFCYDQAGNTTKRTTDTGAIQDLAWDEEGHLRTVTQGGNTWTNIYDVDGTRLIAKTPTGDTLYLPDGTEIKKLTSGQLEATRYYSHNGKTIAVRNGTTLTWMAADHHGTQQVQIAATNLGYQRRRSLPFGETRGTQPTFIGTKGYVGGTIDDTGLTHIGAREYDPTLGRFVSIDPEINHLDPQTLHGYLYSNNNPTTYSDPTGRNWFTSGVKGFRNGLYDSTIGAVVSMVTTVKNETERGFERLNAIQSGDMTYMEAVQDTIDNSMSKAPHPLSGLVATAGLVDKSMQAQSAVLAGDFDTAAEGYGYLGGFGVGTYGVGRGIGGVRGLWNARNARLLGEAEAARDALAAEISESGRPPGANTPESGQSTVVGAYNMFTGRVVAGLNSCPIYCAEYGGMLQLGIPRPFQGLMLRFTGALIEGKRPGQWRPMRVCHYCQTWSNPHQYPVGTKFKPGGAWDGMGGV